MSPLAQLYRGLAPKRRAQFWMLLAFMLGAAIAELVTIGTAIPFLTLIATASPDLHPALRRILGLLGGNFVVAAGAVLIAAAIVAALVRLALVWWSQRFVMAVGNDVAGQIWGRMLRQPYEAYLDRNSSQILGGLEKVRVVVSAILEPAMQGVAAAVLSVVISAFLFVIAPVATGAIAATALMIYLATALATRARLARNSALLAAAVSARTKVIQEGLGCIRDVLLARSQRVFERRFDAVQTDYRHAYVSNMLIGAMPRFLVEAGGIAAIVVVAVVASTRPGGLIGAIPVLGALALGGQRLLPLLQQAYAGWTQSAGNVQALVDVLALMSAPVSAATDEPDAARQPAFTRDIVFDAVSFNYANGREAAHAINLTILRGSRVGILGRTGVGKSTLVDLLMGLLTPTRGEIRIDGRPLGIDNRAAWQASLAHVPQSIYLVDDSIAANIALGEEDVDRDRLLVAARAALLDPFVAGLADGYETRVGERGVQLSGGQRQRVGIARALYRHPQVLILDEATNALDEATETGIFAAIAALDPDLTVVVVAHRTSSVAHCNQIITVDRSVGGTGATAVAAST